MSDDKKSDAGAAASEKPAKEYNLKSPTDVARKGMDEGYATMCCCCVCVLEDHETKDLKCCCIFPIKCGVQFIAASIIWMLLRRCSLPASLTNSEPASALGSSPSRRASTVRAD
jgi:hypothetical protein